MESFVNLYVFFFGILLLTMVVFFLIERPKFKFFKLDYRVNNRIKLALYAAIFCVLFSLIAPIVVIYSIYTGNIEKSFVELSGPVGDTIGGVINPFVAMAGVIVTGLAFFIQYRANQIQRDQFYEGLRVQKKQFDESLKHQKKQFEIEIYTEANRHQELRDTQERVEKIQSFERQFYELLRLHKENVNELTIELDKQSASSGKVISGRRVFILFKNELHLIYKLLSNFYKYSYPKYSGKFNLEIFKLAYYLFFEGIVSFRKVDTQDLAINFRLDSSFIELLKRSLLEAFNSYDSEKENQSFYDFNFDPPQLIIEQSFLFLPFVSQSSRLGHYFRHLFFILKFVCEKDEMLISYSSKRYYLRVLRNQLSNDEQIMLFYNWFSGYGTKWEQSDLLLRKQKQGNYFFTDYRMIHNLDESKLIDGIILNNIFSKFEFKNFRYESNRRKEDILFEVHGYQSSLSEEENQLLT